jgi:stage III sporulation protein AG
MSEERRFGTDLLKMPGLKPLLLLAGLGVLLIIVGSLVKTSPRDSGNAVDGYSGLEPISSETSPPSSAVGDRLSDLSPADRYRVDLETRSAAILSKVEGAGTVSVQITLEGGTYREYAVNSVEEYKNVDEKMSSGEARVTTEKRETRDVVLPSHPSSGRGQSPILVLERSPAISGVLVAASGASDSRTKRELAEAAQTLLGVPAHRVMVVVAKSP